MIDQIKNKTINVNVNGNKASERTNDAKSKVQKIDNPGNVKGNTYDGKVSQFITKEKIKSMSQEPPIDKATTTRIKDAIKNGTYPLDLSKVADALFDAYKEMK